MSIDLRLLGNRFFRTLILSRLCLQTGVWVRNVAVLLFVMDKTGNDPFAVALISAAEFAPIFLFSYIGGISADSFRSKRLMIFCDLMSCLSVVGVLLALMSGEWKAVFFATLLSAVLSQFSEPATMRLFKQHIPEHQLQTGLSMFQTVMAVFTVGGPVLGTYVFQTYGIDVSIAVMAAAFLLSSLILFGLPADRIRPAEQQPDASLLREMRLGVRYLMERPILKRLGGVFMMMGLAIGLIEPISVFIVTDRLGLPKESMQWLMMSNGAGMIVGGLLSMMVSQRLSPQKQLTIGLLVLAGCMALTGLSTSFLLTMAVRFVTGMCMPLVMSGSNTLMLRHTEDVYIGRASGILNLMITGMMVAGVSVSSQLMEAYSLVTMFEVSGWILLVGMLFSLSLFRLLSKPPRSGGFQGRGRV